ncbi:hypothetical protein CF327_g1410 [Tilletia walkeri]|nr:hypothetical protein CF327_g1410 [Tilletia walkeri]
MRDHLHLAIIALACTTFLGGTTARASSVEDFSSSDNAPLAAARPIMRQDIDFDFMFDKKCKTNDDCPIKYCRSGVCALAPAQWICVSDDMCYSKRCTVEACERVGCTYTLCEPVLPLGKCRDSADCQIEENAVCDKQDNRCKATSGHMCTKNKQCLSGKCRSSRCIG